jgi:hypothetical protein
MTNFSRGPIREVPLDYKPEILITDSEFESIYHNHNITPEQCLFARDYVIHKFNQISINNIINSLAQFPTQHLESLFWGLEHCSCCWRHCHNKPISLTSLENRSMLSVATEQMVLERNCHCRCRFVKRLLRRAYFSEFHTPDDLPELEDTNVPIVHVITDSESDEE